MDRDRSFNQAFDHAQVETQISHVDQYVRTMHVHATTFQARDDSPAEKFRIARNYLTAGAAERAGAAFAELLADDPGSTQLAYYRTLSLLTGRPFDRLSRTELEELRYVLAVRRLGPDQWSTALQVIDDLLQCFISQQESTPAGFDDRRFDLVMRRLDQLDPPRREEINRHLEMPLIGGLQDLLDARRSREIKAHRTGHDRRRRVPLFFEPDPAPPRQRRASPPETTASQWTFLVVGGAMLVTGALLMWIRTAAERPLAAAAILALWILGGFGIHRLLPQHLILLATERRRQWELRAAAEHEAYSDDGDLSEFATLVEEQFARVAPPDAMEAFHFTRVSAVDRWRLTRDLESLYGPQSAEPVPAEKLGWLVRWHAHRTALSWQYTTPVTTVQPDMSTLGHVTTLVLSGAVLLAGAVLALVTLADRSPGSVLLMLGLVAMISAGVVLLTRTTPLYTERRRIAEERTAHQDLHAEEIAAWERERRRLSNRPKDTEMAKWLDYDKDHIRLQAMRTWHLTNSDVLAHVVMTEPEPDSKQAWALEENGPRRYPRYVVRLFLLTDNGVRQLDVHLDFASGAENKQQRRAFRYDAIASAVIEEPTVRRHGRRQVATPEGGGPRNGVVRPIRRQTLRLTLLNGHEVMINPTYEDSLSDEQQLDNDALLTLEMETSGAVNTLRMLESVAGEGRAWISRERQRIRHTIEDYQQIRDCPPED